MKWNGFIAGSLSEKQNWWLTYEFSRNWLTSEYMTFVLRMLPRYDFRSNMLMVKNEDDVVPSTRKITDLSV